MLGDLHCATSTKRDGARVFLFDCRYVGFRGGDLHGFNVGEIGTMVRSNGIPRALVSES